MPDVKLTNGREFTFDLSLISMREYRALLDTSQPAEVGDDLIARTTAGALTADELADLPQPEYRRLVQAFFKKAREPLADPKLASAPTSA